jgi:1,2-phenylacetyl-CoA epoxidase catalytic subunit
MRSTTLPKKYHDAVERWRDTYLPDYDLLIRNWDRFFPKDPQFELCAFRELGMCGEVECGEFKGQPKATEAAKLDPSQAAHLLGAIRAQASTEFGSIQQHQLTLARAQDEQDQFWVMRMMAEELRHGYQMLHLLLEDDWSSVTDTSGEDMVEEILSMRTGSHILGAFNVDFDSFVDNITFCCLIDRVGKYQLAMQKVSAYQPMAESMPQMLREEAFHLATGVVPMRRWAEQAARGSIYITMDDMQKVLNKWLPRGLEMFGDERGGGTNVRFGLKPMKNAEAQQEYYDEVEKVVADLNMRFIRARLPELGPREAEDLLRRVSEDGETREGIRPEDLLRIPHKEFFRRRGVPAFRWIGFGGEEFEHLDSYVEHLTKMLPDAYRAGRDFKFYLELARQVDAGELTSDEASRKMPGLRRVGGVCPCSRAVRWVVDEDVDSPNGNGNGHGPGSP